MIVYLNNQKSIARNPNENLAREFFELFSLGEGNYTENDIKNFARHISGNSINHITEQYPIIPIQTIQVLLITFGKKYKNDEDFLKF